MTNSETRSTIVAVVDASHARVFALARDTSAGTTRLVPVAELEQPERRTVPSEKFSDTRPGIRRAKGTAHGVDDHRDSNIEAHDKSFARDVAKDLASRAAAPEIAVLVLAASPRMLGMLRPAVDAIEDIAVRDIAANVAQRTVTEIHDFLSAKDLLPPRGRLL